MGGGGGGGGGGGVAGNTECATSPLQNDSCIGLKEVIVHIATTFPPPPKIIVNLTDQHAYEKHIRRLTSLISNQYSHRVLTTASSAISYLAYVMLGAWAVPDARGAPYLEIGP